MLNIVTYGGKSNWFQGVILVAMFIAIAMEFFIVK